MNWIFLIAIFIAGLIFGSFLNALIWRWGPNTKVQTVRSICPQCRKQLFWYHNIPIISFVFLKGRCAFCQKHISWQYPLIELVAALLFVRVGMHHDAVFDIMLVRDLIIALLLLAIALYDYRYRLILDRFTTIPALLYFLLAIVFRWNSWENMVLGAAIGGGLFLFQFLVSKGRWVGGGDIRMGLFMGVLLGWQGTLLALLIAYMSGALVGVWLLMTKRATRQSEIAFGTFLAFATFVSYICGEPILDWYFSLLTIV